MDQKIAIIADVHANLFALDAVIEDIEGLGVDEVLVAGDLVGRGPQGSAVVHRIAEKNWRCARGNHEDLLLSFCRKDIPDRWKTATEWVASHWMADELDEDAEAFISELPFSIRSSIDPGIEVYHGSPNSDREGIGAWTPEDRLQAFLDAIDGQILVCAHTHRPLLYRGQEGMILNVGSVGLPFNGDWRAQYALLTGNPGDWEITFRQVEYPRQSFLHYYETSGFLEHGGVTVDLLRQEVLHARPFLVPFLSWADLTDHAPTREFLPAFLELYDHTLPMSVFLAGIKDDQS